MFVETPFGKEKVALWWSREPGGVRCTLCPHVCLVKQDERGRCRVRANIDGMLISENYERVCVQAVDTVEKKPLYHFKPGARLLSLGTFGCNMTCLNCQNYFLSQSPREQVDCGLIPPEEVVDHALASAVDGIAFTFNEPIVWMEYVLEVSRLARRKGLFLSVNTNGFITRSALEDILPWLDAVNIDVKGFSDSFYRSNCGGRLNPVLEACARVATTGPHLEITYLLIPGLNDSKEELEDFFHWVVRELGTDVPIHIFRFLPFYRLSQLPPASLEQMEEAHQLASAAGLRFVYFGGVMEHEHQNTYCPRCGNLVIRRESERTTKKVSLGEEEISRFCPSFPKVELRLEKGRCTVCGENIPVRF